MLAAAVVAAEPHIATADAPGDMAVRIAHGSTRGAGDGVGAAKAPVEPNSSEPAMQPQMIRRSNIDLILASGLTVGATLESLIQNGG